MESLLCAGPAIQARHAAHLRDYTKELAVASGFKWAAPARQKGAEIARGVPSPFLAAQPGEGGIGSFSLLTVHFSPTAQQA